MVAVSATVEKVVTGTAVERVGTDTAIELIITIIAMQGIRTTATIEVIVGCRAEQKIVAIFPDDEIDPRGAVYGVPVSSAEKG
jgi:hypothetical protein